MTEHKFKTESPQKRSIGKAKIVLFANLYQFTLLLVDALANEKRVLQTSLFGKLLGAFLIRPTATANSKKENKAPTGLWPTGSLGEGCGSPSRSFELASRQRAYHKRLT